MTARNFPSLFDDVLSVSSREELRQKGQFWTPEWVAEAMVGYLIAGGSEELFDPAVGAGVFFRAAKNLFAETQRKLTLSGTEIDPNILDEAIRNGLQRTELENVQFRDFVLDPPHKLFSGIAANPPYIRHHRLPQKSKTQLKALARGVIGKELDGRAGLHIYFLIRALQCLRPNGKLAFIVPADICEGVFAGDLWNWITRNFCLEAVVTFTPGATPFPGVDTNPIIFFISYSLPRETFLWAECQKANTEQLKRWTLSRFATAGRDLQVYQRHISEALSTGFSRTPLADDASAITLADFAVTRRGIATGANDFFFLTPEQANFYRIPAEFLHLAIGRTRDVPGDQVTEDVLEALRQRGRPTLLFSPDERPLEQFPQSVQNYLRYGEELGLPKRPLIATRNPWYKMESREVPPILFACLGRRNVRFIRNLAGVLPLTGFLCVYPRRESAAFVDKLYAVLQHLETIANLALVGKSYGGGAIKVEPRSLERLPLPKDVVQQVGLKTNLREYRQLSFLSHLT